MKMSEIFDFNSDLDDHIHRVNPNTSYAWYKFGQYILMLSLNVSIQLSDEEDEPSIRRNATRSFNNQHHV